MPHLESYLTLVRSNPVVNQFPQDTGLFRHLFSLSITCSLTILYNKNSSVTQDVDHSSSNPVVIQLPQDTGLLRVHLFLLSIKDSQCLQFT